MDDEIKVAAIVVAGVLGFMALIFGALMFGNVLKNECIKTLKDKPAIEIRLVCGG